MLVVHPSSSCDVCLEPYNNAGRTPDVIPCGHVFCHSCLESLNRLACPLCRDRFQPHEVRKLRIDPTASPSPAGKELVRRVRTLPPDARRFLDTVQGFIRDGAPSPLFRQLANEMMAWLAHQPSDQFEELRILTRLLLSVDQWFNKARKLEADLRQANGRIEEGSLRIENAERELQELMRSGYEERLAAESRYQDLLTQSQDEKETAYAVETSLREHLANVNQRIDELLDENRKLVEQAQFAGFDLQQFQQPVAVDDIEVPDVEVPSVPVTKDVARKAKASKGLAAPTPATSTIPFLSPLPLAISISSPVTSFITFAPLPNDEANELSVEPQVSAYTPPSPLIEPIPVRHRAPAPPGGLSRTRPAEAEQTPDPQPPHSLPTPPQTELSHNRPEFRHSPPIPTQPRPNERNVESSSGQDRHPGTQPAHADTGRPPVPPTGLVDEAEAERNRALQLQEILSSPMPPSVRLSTFTLDADPRRKAHAMQASTPRPADGDSTDLRPRARRELSHSASRASFLHHTPSESRLRARSDASFTRPEPVTTRSNLSESFSVPPAGSVSTSLSHRHEVEIFREGHGDLRLRTHSEQSANRPTATPPRSADPMSRSIQQLPIPTPASSHTTQPSSASSTPSNPSHVRPGLVHRDSCRQAVSTASHAALALEKEQKEKRKAEKEKERERERERERAEMERLQREEREREIHQRDWSKTRMGVQTAATSGAYGSPAPSLYRGTTPGISRTAKAK